MKNALEKIRNDGKIRTGYLAGFIFLFIACVVTLYTNRQLTLQSKRVENTNKIISSLEAALSEAKDAETGVRGYIINHDSSFLQLYTGSKKNIDSIFTVLVKQTSDNESQQERLGELNELIGKRYSTLEENVVVYNRNGKLIIDSIYTIQVRGKRLMDAVRNQTVAIKAYEANLLAARTKRLNSNFNALNAIVISTLAMAVAILIFGFITHSKEREARKEAEKKILDYQDELQTRIQELDKANQELIRMRSQEKFAATGRMARTIAHEVRNPMTNINLAVDQLKAEIVNPDENTNFLFDMISRNSHRINQLISDLLNSTKFSELTFSKISINDLLDETLKEAGDRASFLNVEVIKNYSKDLCSVTVDKERIKIAMLNIIINAFEAMEEKDGSKLWVETKSEYDKCKIVITDNGPGIDNEALSKIFEPYFTSKQKGNGLGLTNTQNIILNHQGDIMVQSEVNKGTSFVITLDFSK